jgi:hypothetical protein
VFTQQFEIIPLKCAFAIVKLILLDSIPSLFGKETIFFHVKMYFDIMEWQSQHKRE